MAATTPTSSSASAEEGVLFPRTDPESDLRATTPTATSILADAVRSESAEAATAIENEQSWRSQYPKHFVRLVELALATPSASSRISRYGLDSLHRRMVFRRNHEEVSTAEALAAWDDDPWGTVTIEGIGRRIERLEVPYQGKLLAGDALLRQVDRWETAGVIEASHGDAIRRVVANPDWLDLAGDGQTFALMGAGAELGPFEVLSRWGATVAALDLPRAAGWERILAMARRGAGRTLVPVRSGPQEETNDLAGRIGADLMVDVPEVRGWLARIEGPMTLGAYTYLDGGRHVRVNTATDAIAVDLAARRNDISLAYLLTPTNVFAVPAEVAAASRRAWANRSRTVRLAQSAAATASRGSLFQPSIRTMITTEDGWRGGVVDCLVVEQGPNYALAKRLQHWRAVVAREAGIRVSVNVAPPSATTSVIKNPALAAAYEGAGRFGIEVFAPDTSNSLMAALLVHDLRYDGALANPATPMRNGLELFMEGANHGGLWRSAYLPRTMLGVAGVLGFPSAQVKARRKLPLPLQP